MQETRHIEEWVQAWTDIQQRMWAPWIRAAQYTGQLPRMETGGWDVRTALAAYGRVVQSGLEAQRTWTRLWLRSLGTDEQAPPVMAEWGRFLLTLAENWTDAQGRLWEIWSESVQSLGPGAAVAAWEQAIHAWRLALQTCLEGQTPLVVRDSAADTAGREAYCMKCRQKRPLIDGRKVTMKNGRAAIQSRCPVCGSTLNLILPAPAATAGDAANGWMRHSRQ